MDQAFRKYGLVPYNVVLVHGGPGAVGEMAEVARTLATDYGIIESLHRELTIRNQLRGLSDVIEKESTEPVVLIGFSWGAWLSILFVSEFKQYVKKLILIGCGPLEAEYAADIYKTRLSRLIKSDQKQFRTILDSLADQKIQDLSSAFEELSMLIQKTDNYDRFSDSSATAEIHPEVFISIWKEADFLRKEGKLIDAIKKIDIPLHVIHGDYDPHPAAGIIKPLQIINKDFQYEILIHCGHKPWIEKYARSRFYELLREIISG